jgi:Response regulators consisting of a CheY-like receiver domain and a winged-helix DNA-binding domain
MKKMLISGQSTLPVDILLVEDNPGDVQLTKEAMLETKILTNLFVVEDGVEAIEFLFKKGKYQKMPRPDIIILDLNLPLKDGREVLEIVKQDESLKRIPVVVLTSSKAEEDIIRSYNLHANCYITKPLDFEQFIQIVKNIEQFWFTIVRLPD